MNISRSEKQRRQISALAESSLGLRNPPAVEKRLDPEQYRAEYGERVDQLTAGRETTYLSTPITGGLGLYEFLKQRGLSHRSEISGPDQLAFEEIVVKPNAARAKSEADRLRAEGETVINPAEKGQLKGWNQGDYMALWLETINESTDKVVMRDGWEFSTGSVLELREALQIGLPVQEQNGDSITLEQALSRVKASDSRVQEMGFEDPGLDEILLDDTMLPGSYLRSL